VPPGFAVAAKLSSADFQRGGFSEDDARAVVEMLNHEGIDLLELSGGSHESPAIQGRTADGRTLALEAYFLELAHGLAKMARMPLVTTGGIRRRSVAERVLDGGMTLVGLGTALAFEPALPMRWQHAETVAKPVTVKLEEQGVGQPRHDGHGTSTVSQDGRGARAIRPRMACHQSSDRPPESQALYQAASAMASGTGGVAGLSHRLRQSRRTC
jgi:hypothetical protein